MYDNVLRSQALENKFRELLERESAVSQANLVVDSTMGIEERNFEERLVKLDEMRDLVLDKRMEMGEDMARKTAKGKAPRESGELVKLRRLGQDNQRFHKLESRWEGSYRVKSVSANKKSVWLEDLNTGQEKGKFHANHTFLFLERNRYQDQTQMWKSVREINFQVRENVRHWMKKMMERKKKQMHAVDKDFNEEEEDNDASSIEWWQSASGFSFEGYGDEHNWNYWRRKGVAIDLQILMERGDAYLEAFMVSRLTVDESYDL